MSFLKFPRMFSFRFAIRKIKCMDQIMKISSKVISALGLFLLLAVSPVGVLFGESQESSPTYHYQADTVWAKISVTLQDGQDHFKLSGQSDTSATQWVLKDARKRKVAHGDLDSANRFQADIPKPFRENFQLTVIVRGDQGDIPIVIQLKPGAEEVWVTPTPPPYDAFIEDAKRPYNKIVKNFYEQAAQSYVDGDKDKAIEFLEKAADLDPSQAQVRTLMAKCKAGKDSLTIVSTPASPAEEVQPEPTRPAKNPAGAARHLSTTKHKNAATTNSATTPLKDHLLEKNVQQLESALRGGDVATAEKTLRRLKQVEPGDARLPGWEDQLDRLAHPHSQDSQSKADEAYNLGLESYRKEDYASARKFWEETLRFQPNHPQAKRNLDRLKEEHPDLK